MPFVLDKTFLRRFVCCVPRFTRGILLVVWNQGFKSVLERLGKFLVPALIARCFSIFSAIKVILSARAFEDLTGFRDLYPLFESFVSFLLHRINPNGLPEV